MRAAHWLAALGACGAIPMVALAAGPTLPERPVPLPGASGLPQHVALSWQFAPVSAGCGVLLGAAHEGAGSGEPGPSSLYAIDPATGIATLIGPIGFNGVGAMTFGADGALYAAAAGENPPGSNPKRAILIRIDPTTGAGTFIGEIGSQSNPGEIFRVRDLTTSPTGVVYGVGFYSGENLLFQVNTTSAAPTYVGAIEGDYPSALDFSPAGVLTALTYGDSLSPLWVRFATVDPNTAAVTLGLPPSAILGNEFVIAADYCPDSGELYFVDHRFGPDLWRLMRGDPATGVVSLDVPAITGLDAIAFNPARITYDVYLDTNNPPTTLLCDDAPAPACDTGPLQRCTTYYWRVVASANGTPVPGPVWSFTTGFFSPADTDGDGDVDFIDLNNLLGDYGLGPACLPGDPPGKPATR